MKHAIDPTIDCVFKAILGSNEHINLLLNFLNSVCQDDIASPICDITIQNPYNEKEFLSDKLSIIDIKAKDKAGNIFQIEIQMAVPQSLKYRMLHNWAELYSRQLKEGDTWNTLKPVISIWLVCEPVFSDFSGFHSQFCFYDAKNKLELVNQHAKIHIIELSKWNKLKINDDLDVWTHFFKDGKSFSLNGLPDNMLTDEMEEAMSVLRQFSEKEKAYDRYMLRVEYLREQNTLKEDREIAQAELEETKKDLSEIKKDLGETKKDLGETKKDLGETKKYLDKTKDELLQTKQDSKAKDRAISDAQVEIEKLRQQLQKK